MRRQYKVILSYCRLKKQDSDWLKFARETQRGILLGFSRTQPEFKLLFKRRPEMMIERKQERPLQLLSRNLELFFAYLNSLFMLWLHSR